MADAPHNLNPFAGETVACDTAPAPECQRGHLVPGVGQQPDPPLSGLGGILHSEKPVSVPFAGLDDCSVPESRAVVSNYVRKEVIGRATLYQADCNDILGGLSVDHVISDPPYEDELHAAIGRIRRNDGREMISDLGFEGINATRDEITRLCVEASQGWCLLFTLAEGVRAWRDALQAAGAKYHTCCAWVKPDSAPRFNGQGPARGFECFVTAWCAPGYRSWNAGGKRGIYTHLVNNPERTGLHPTEKPRRLMAEIIADFTLPDQSICDPFMGSGTTGVAAVQMGRDFIGIERDPAHFDLACRRIEEAQRQGDLFLDNHPPHHIRSQLSKLDGFESADGVGGSFHTSGNT